MASSSKYSGSSAGKSRVAADTVGDDGQIKKGDILSAYPQDNAGGMHLPNTTGGKMGGSPTNLSHSLRGASAVQDGPGATTKTKTSRASS